MTVTLARATLRLVSTIGSAADVTAALGIEPSESWERGQIRGTHRPRLADRAGWFLCSRPDDRQDLEVHLHDLLDRLAGHETALSALAGSWDIDFFCFVGSDHGPGGLCFSPRLLARLGSLPTQFGLDLYLSPEDQEE